MLERSILKPVLPEIEPKRMAELGALIAAEGKAGIELDPLRRLAALLPRDPLIAEDVAARLRLSNKARKRLACAAAAEPFSSAQALAYRLGSTGAVDRLLLADEAQQAAAIAQWKAPRLPISGGQLIKRGLPEGPIVARTLRAIEDRWVEAGFPDGAEFERIVGEALTAAG
jgi:poly(A) polymerase